MNKTTRPREYIVQNIKICEWKVNADGKTFSNFTPEKFFKNDNDEWVTSKNFGINELFVLKRLIDHVLNEKLEVKNRNV